MRLNSLMKNPILAIGILMSVIAYFQVADKGLLEARKAKLTPSSCKALLVKLDRLKDSSWETSCEGGNFNNLAIKVRSKASKNLEGNVLKQALYREIANHFVFVAKKSPSDNLERTDIIRIRLTHPKLVINALSEGKFVIKLSTLKNSRLIAEHFHRTVQVQEVQK